MNEERIIQNLPKYKAIQYRNGWQLVSPKIQAVSARNSIGAKRGTVKRFSKAARRRLAQTLLSLDYTRGISFSVTLTIPGCNATNVDVKRAFALWSMDAAHAGWSAVWRMELQRRGVLHYHLWLGIPYHKGVMDLGEFQTVMATIRQSWAAACDRIGYRRNDLTGSVMPISEMPGFKDHGCRVGWEDGNDKADFWFRYLATHALKDDHQECTEHGRHWGVIGRKGFASAKLQEVVLTEQEHAEICKGFHEANKDKFQAQFERWRRGLPETLTPEQQAKLDRWERWLQDGGKREGTFTFFGRTVLDKLVFHS